MEIRGLGLINIRDLFGVAAIRNAKRVELVVQLERWDPERDYERLGIDELRYDILGIRVPLVRMPVAPGAASVSSSKSPRATSCSAAAG